MYEHQEREFGRGPICSMKNCYNYGTQQDSLSFFRFPTDLRLCTQWVLVSGRKDLIDRLETNGHGRLNRSSHRYCSAHFSPTSFKNPNNHSQGLRKGTVPTLCVGNPNAIQQQSPVTMQIGGLDQPCSSQLDHNGSQSPKLQMPLPRPEKTQIRGLYQACSIKYKAASITREHNRSPATLPQSQSDPVPDVGTTKFNRDEFKQQMKTWNIEHNNKTLRLKLKTSQNLTYRLKKKVEKMKNEIEVLKRQALRYNENFIDISPGAIGDNLLATLLGHSRTKSLGRRYGPIEKSFALELYRCSRKAYALVQKRLNLPTKRILNRDLQQQRKAVSSDTNVNVPEDALNQSTAVATCM